MYEKFLNHANYLENKSLMETELLFLSCKNKWFTEFANHFIMICEKISALQKEKVITDLSRIEYTMLYTNFINRRYVLEIWVYGAQGYLDKKQYMVGEYDISFLFVTFDGLWNNLLKEMKAYPGKVHSREITAFMLERLPYFHSYFSKIMRFAIQDFLDKKPFTDIIKNDTFILCSGDYMAKTEHIYRMDKHKKSLKDICSWFSEGIKFAYTYGDYSNLDFSNVKMKGIDLRYAIFRHSNFFNASFKRSLLKGACFYGVNMEKCCLRLSVLHEADFSNASLKDADLAKINARAGVRNKEIWDYVGYMPASFRNADLTNTYFRLADLTGADFRGAKLTNTNFSDAILDNAIFSAKDIPLSEEQLSRIIIIEEG